MAFADLDVWMNGQHVGLWFWTRTGTPGFRYDESWLRSPQARPLSVSLPMPAGGGDVMGAKVEHYFDNLLPDSGRIRERLRRRFETSSIRAADLLAAVGRDCVGALQLMPQGLAGGRLPDLDCRCAGKNSTAAHRPALAPAVGLYAYHAHLQAALGPGGQYARRHDGLGGERMALRHPAGRTGV
jgi:HipA-like protein